MITLSHGSGGMLTQRLLKDCVFDLIKSDFLDKEDDGAILDINGQVAVSTDSYVVSPIFFPGGDIGSLAVHGTVNDVAMCGAIPKYITLGLIIEEGLPIIDFWKILLSIRKASIDSGIQIITGDTKVVERGKGDKIFINTTGIGEVHPKASLDISRIRPGDKVIISGPIASHGTTILTMREGLDFESDIRTDSAPLNHIVKVLLDHIGENIHFMRDPTRGGVAMVLNELARHTHFGVEIHEESLPILEPVRNLCEILGLDPLQVANEGIFLSIVAKEAAEKSLSFIKQQSSGRMAKIIGEITENNKNRVLLRNDLGGVRVIQMPLGEQLPRIC
jgi:hydrogenase expression/formation protein HypE